MSISYGDCLQSLNKNTYTSERQEQVQVRERGTQEQPTSIFALAMVFAFSVVILAVILSYLFHVFANKFSDYEFTEDELIRNFITEEQKKKFEDPLIRPPTFREDKYHNISQIFTDPELYIISTQKGEQKHTSLLELLNIIKSRDSCKVLITGNGGIGKTTLLKYISYNWATNSDTTFADKILFFVNLRDIKEGQTITDTTVDEVDLKRFRKKTGLHINKTIIKMFIEDHDRELVFLIDGLDELNSGVDIPMILKSKELEESTVILTSRPGFTESLHKYYDIRVKVEGFDIKNIKPYIKRYFKSIGQSKMGQLLISEFNLDSDDVTSWGGNHKYIFELFSSPFLLLKMCVVWEHQQMIPKNLEHLFKEIFRTILNQYINRRDEPTTKAITDFDNIPTDYKNAIIILGEISYIGLKRILLHFTKTEVNTLVKNETLVDLALKLGFVYKDTSTVQDSFLETYRSPHRLLSEALAGYYLSNKIETLDPLECEIIRLHPLLPIVTVFTISFLGPNADKLMKHWLVNRASNYYSFSKYFTYVNPKYQKKVLTLLDKQISPQMKMDVKDLRDSFRTFVCNDNLHLIELLNIFRNRLRKDSNNITRMISSSMMEYNKHCECMCSIIAHYSIILQLYNADTIQADLTQYNRDGYLIKLIEKHGDEALEILSFEWKKYNVGKEIRSFMFIEDDSRFLYRRHTGSRMCKLFQNFPNLSLLLIRFSRDSKGASHSSLINSMLTECKHSKTFVNLRWFLLGNNNLSNINGALLGHFLNVYKDLEMFDLSNCSLSSAEIVDMLNEVDISYLESKENFINLENNDLSNLDSNLLANLINSLIISDVNDTLYGFSWFLHSLSAQQLHDLLISPKRYRFKWKFLNLDFVDLSSINGSTLANIFIKFPNLKRLSMNYCKLVNYNVIDLLKGYSGKGIKVDLISLDGNYLYDIHDKLLFKSMVITQTNSSITLKGQSLDLRPYHSCIIQKRNKHRLNLFLESSIYNHKIAFLSLITCYYLLLYILHNRGYIRFYHFIYLISLSLFIKCMCILFAVLLGLSKEL
ncbi:uncharacterized protein [Antedon mediterranea]|uniref:uncharacterized protein isoform X1 n=1 Tax=Antedon mediterranea TaxID=105859 RepID=UPI003AF92DB7